MIYFPLPPSLLVLLSPRSRQKNLDNQISKDGPVSTQNRAIKMGYSCPKARPVESVGPMPDILSLSIACTLGDNGIMLSRRGDELVMA